MSQTITESETELASGIDSVLLGPLVAAVATMGVTAACMQPWPDLIRCQAARWALQCYRDYKLAHAVPLRAAGRRRGKAAPDNDPPPVPDPPPASPPAAALFPYPMLSDEEWNARRDRKRNIQRYAAGMPPLPGYEGYVPDLNDLDVVAIIDRARADQRRAAGAADPTPAAPAPPAPPPPGHARREAERTLAKRDAEVEAAQARIKALLAIPPHLYNRDRARLEFDSATYAGKEARERQYTWENDCAVIALREKGIIQPGKGAPAILDDRGYHWTPDGQHACRHDLGCPCGIDRGLPVTALIDFVERISPW